MITSNTWPNGFDRSILKLSQILLETVCLSNLCKMRELIESPVSHPALEAVCGFTPSWIQPWIQTLALARPLLSNDLLAELKDYDPIEAIALSFDRDQLDGRHVLDKAQYTWIKTMLECQILNWGGDRVDMANSMESV